MSTLITMDPGKHACGVSVFHGDTLYRAALVRPNPSAGSSLTRWNAMALAVHEFVEDCRIGPAWVKARFVSETPMIYPGTSQVRPMDLLDLAGYVGAVAGALNMPATSYYPRDWKGTLDGDAFIEKRIKPVLTPEEAERVSWPAPSLRHNVYDSIGLGFFVLGRLERKRVFSP